MGYRSEVAFVLLKKDFIEMLEKAKDENEYAYELLNSAEYLYNKDPNENEFITVHYPWLKWYNCFSEVEWIENYITEIPHMFSRAGEASEELDAENWFGDEEYDMYQYCEAQATVFLEGEKIKMEEICSSENTNSETQNS